MDYRHALCHYRALDTVPSAYGQFQGPAAKGGDQAGCQVCRAKLGAVAELDHQRNEIDDDGREQLRGMVHFGTVHVPQEEAEVERAGKDGEEAEDHFFKVHTSLQVHRGGSVDVIARAARMSAAVPSVAKRTRFIGRSRCVM